VSKSVDCVGVFVPAELTSELWTGINSLAMYATSPFCLRSMSTMRLPNGQTSKKRSVFQIDFVRVTGRYRVGKLLGSGGSGESTQALIRHPL
jgi:hypothetical protein